MTEWFWLPKAWGVADGGAYAKLFQGKGYSWEILAREVTQNSWDAARRWQQELLKNGRISSESDVRFEMVFDFKNLIGRNKSNLVAGLRLQDLRSKLLQIQESERDVDPDGGCMGALGDEFVPLKALYIHDFGATGLRGDPLGKGMQKSDFYRAFGQIGGNDRQDGGGSYGFGKSAFIKASRLRCVVAYSSFEATKEDPVTRRLWGFVYWKGFDEMTGIAQLGTLLQDQIPKSSPLTDRSADELAKQLGFQVRNAASPSDCGTSLLIVDHVVEPSDLQEALERNWWPALETFKSRFSVRIKTEGGFLDLQPRSREYLLPFIRAFEIARDANAQVKESGEKRKALQPISEAGEIRPGVIALVRVDDAQHSKLLGDDLEQSLVALIREPRMVVQYQPHGTTLPIVQGVFLADQQADGPLRSSEPGAHDVWQTHIAEDHGKDWEITRTVVQVVQRRIRESVLEFQRFLRPKPERQDDRLRFAEELLSRLFRPESNRGSGGSVKKNRRAAKVSVERIARKINRLADGQISCEEIWEVAVDKSPAKAKYRLTLTPKAIVMSDGDAGNASKDDHLSLSIVATPSWSVLAEAKVDGLSAAGSKTRFTVTTEPYSCMWSIRTEVHVEARAV